MSDDIKQTNNNQQTTNSTQPVANTISQQDTPPVLAVEDVVPPMPQVGIPQKEEDKTTQVDKEGVVDANGISTSSGSAAPSDDIQVSPVVIGTTPKKKFGSGKVIATILGLLVLIGGAGAGTYLVQQNQNINEKALVYECFPAGTKISTENGTKNIEDFEIGDNVISENAGGTKSLSNVTKVFKLFSYNMCTIDFDGGEKLSLTYPHPLYTMEGWKAINVEQALKHNPSLSISQLTENDFVKKRDGSWDKINSISCKYGLFRVYNLAVDNNNNYFAEDYLAHNKGGVNFVPDTTHDYYLDDNQDVIYEYDENNDVVQDNSNNPNVPSSINYNTDPNNCGGAGIVCHSSKSCYQGDCMYGNSTSGSVNGSCNTTYINGRVGAGDGGGSGVSGTFQCAGGVNTSSGCDQSNGSQINNDFDPTSDCFCGTVQQDFHDGTFVSFFGNDCTGNSSGGGNPPGDNPPTTPPTITATCQNVKAYSTSWTELTTAQLSALTPNTTVNFCVIGALTGGSFTKARFTINGVLQPETTTVRPSSTDFCQSYVIPAGVTSHNVTAQIYHNSLGWK